MLGTLRERGVLDRTIVVVTSDHGETFGEHGLSGHGNSLYREVVHVPLLIVASSVVPRGRRISSVVSQTDLAATTRNRVDDPSLADVVRRLPRNGWTHAETVRL